MKIAFYAPLKPISHPNPSGDREIARDLHRFFSEQPKTKVITLSEFRTPWFYQSIGGWAALAKAMRAARKIVKKERPDVFFTYHMYYKAPDPLAPLLSALLRKPYVLYEAMYSRRPRRSLKTVAGYVWARVALQRATHVFTNKSDDYANLIRLLPKDRVTYLPPSVDVDVFTANASARARFRKKHKVGEDEKVIVCVAMLRPGRKTEGVQFLVDCLAGLANDGEKFRFFLAGGGDDLSKMKKEIAAKLPLAGTALGSVSREEVIELLQASDLFAFPGIDEGFGLVYIEAASCGIPSVAFANGGVADAIKHDKTGLLTPLLDRSAYSAALRKLLRNDSLRTDMGAAARAYVEENHNLKKNYGQIYGFMKKLTAKKK